MSNRQSGVLLPWVQWNWAEFLVICHWWNSPSAFQSAVDQVNSPMRRKAMKAVQNAALRVAPLWVEGSSLDTRQSRRSRVMGSVDHGSPAVRPAVRLGAP